MYNTLEIIWKGTAMYFPVASSVTALERLKETTTSYSVQSDSGPRFEDHAPRLRNITWTPSSRLFGALNVLCP
jgi:hypothetical protein